jgi:hypothetical protein
MYLRVETNKIQTDRWGLLDTSKEVGLEINAEKTKYIYGSSLDYRIKSLCKDTEANKRFEN